MSSGLADLLLSGLPEWVVVEAAVAIRVVVWVVGEEVVVGMCRLDHVEGATISQSHPGEPKATLPVSGLARTRRHFL